VFRDDRFSLAARAAGESVWRRGLLVKGPGLCHGVGGNGYSFLRTLPATRENYNKKYEGIPIADGDGDA
jgi:hypothetical protein